MTFDCFFVLRAIKTADTLLVQAGMVPAAGASEDEMAPMIKTIRTDANGLSDANVYVDGVLVGSVGRTWRRLGGSGWALTPAGGTELHHVYRTRHEAVAALVRKANKAR